MTIVKGDGQELFLEQSEMINYLITKDAMKIFSHFPWNVVEKSSWDDQESTSVKFN